MGWRSDLLQKLPPRVSMTIRSRYGFSREPEMGAVERFVRPGDHCVDIGAHLGIYSHLFLRLNGPAGRVTALEPQPELAGYLAAAFRPQIRSGRVVLHQTALGESAGEARLSLPREGRSVNRGRASLLAHDADSLDITVPVQRLDDLGLSGVSFVKCDVEGFELSVLRGAERLLTDDAPVLLVEIEEQHAGDKVAETFRLLGAHGYVVAAYDDAADAMARLPADTPDIPAVVADWVGRYVNNYFFVPESRLGDLGGATVLGAA